MDLRTLEDARVREDSIRVSEAFATKGKGKGRRRPPKAISLLTAIPGTRTCRHAGIPTNYCSCQHLDVADPIAPDVQRAASFVIQQVNSMLSDRPQCWILSLEAVLDARKGAPLRSNAKEAAEEREYQVRLRTRPGEALLSATVRHHIKSGRMQLAGSVSRLNAYGNTSWCVDSTALRPLCHCVSPAPKSTASTMGQPRPVMCAFSLRKTVTNDLD